MQLSAAVLRCATYGAYVAGFAVEMGNVRAGALYVEASVLSFVARIVL